eukprot:GSMAST32.ASY1.ANO1.2119.1 assembled CDS
MSLQAQLQQLRAQRGGGAVQSRLNRKRCFTILYESPRAAADVSVDVLHSQAINGLLTLTQMCPALAAFENTLLAPSTTTLERGLLGKQENNALDKSISRFLRLISPYILLRAAHKVFEYLLRVYEVHEWNIDAIMECILPFHQTDLFGKFVSTLQITDSSMWHFLKGVKKNKSQLMGSVLIEQCRKDPKGLLDFICRLPSRSIESGASSKTAATFTSVVVVGVLQKGVPSDSIVRCVLSSALSLLNTSQTKQEQHCIASAYLIITQVATSVELSENVFNNIVDTISSLFIESKTNFGMNMYHDALLCLFCIFETQRPTSFPSTAAYRILNTASLTALRHGNGGDDFESGIVAILEGIFTNDDETTSCAGQSIFVTLLLESLASLLVTQYDKFRFILQEFLDRGRNILNDSHSWQSFCHIVVENTTDLIQNSKNSNDDDILKTLKKILHSVEVKYPESLDAALSKFLHIQNDKRNEQTEKIANVIHKMLSGSNLPLRLRPVVLDTNSSMMGSCNSKRITTTVALGLQHPLAAVRMKSVEHISTSLSSIVKTCESDETEDKKQHEAFLFFQNNFVPLLKNCLFDDEADVSINVLPLLSMIADLSKSTRTVPIELNRQATFGKEELAEILFSRLCKMLDKKTSSKTKLPPMIETESKTFICEILRRFPLPLPESVSDDAASGHVSTGGFCSLLLQLFPKVVDKVHEIHKAAIDAADRSEHWLFSGISKSISKKGTAEKLLSVLAQNICNNSEKQIESWMCRGQGKWIFFRAASLALQGMKDKKNKENKKNKKNKNVMPSFIVSLLPHLFLELSLLANECTQKIDHSTTIKKAKSPPYIRERRIRPSSFESQVAVMIKFIEIAFSHLPMINGDTNLDSTAYTNAINTSSGLINGSLDFERWVSDKTENVALIVNIASLRGLLRLPQPMFAWFQPILCDLLGLQFGSCGVSKVLSFLYSSLQFDNAPVAIVQERALLLNAKLIANDEESAKLSTLLFVPLTSPNTKIRLTTLQVIESIISSIGNSDLAKGLKNIFSLTVQNKHSISTDPDAVAHILAPICRESKLSKGNKKAVQVILKNVVSSNISTFSQWKILSVFRFVCPKTIMTSCLPLLRSLLSRASRTLQKGVEYENELDINENASIDILLNCAFKARTSTIGTPVETLLLDLFTDGCLFSTKYVKQVIPLIDASLYESISNSAKLKLFVALLKVIAHNNSDVATLARDALQRIPITNELLIKQIEFAYSHIATSIVIAKAPPREDVEIVAQASMKDRISEGLSFLETLSAVIQKRIEDLKSPVEITKALFNALVSLQPLVCTLEANDEMNASISNLGGTTSDFIVVQVISCLSGLIKKLSTSIQNIETEDEWSQIASKDALDALVACIRFTNNQQVRNAALQLLGTIASAAPHKILNLILPILKWAGNGALQQEDSYTFYIIQGIVRSAIPPLLANGLRIGPLLESCIAAAAGAPIIRQLRLLNCVIASSGPKHLAAAVLLILSGCGGPPEGMKSVDMSELCHSLLQSFGVKHQLVALRCILATSKMLFNNTKELYEFLENDTIVEKLNPSSEDSLDDLCHTKILLKEIHAGCKANSVISNRVGHSTTKNGAFILDPQHLAVLSVGFVGSHLNTRKYISMAIAHKKRKVKAQIQRNYLHLCQHIFELIRSPNSTQCDDTISKSLGDKMSTAVYGILDMLNQLLSVPGFLAAIGELLQHEDHTVRKKALELFNRRVQEHGDSLNKQPEDLMLFLDMTTSLEAVILSDIPQTCVDNALTALLSLHVLSGTFAKNNPGPFLKILPAVIHVAQVSQGQLLGSALGVFASIALAVGPKAIPYLPRVVPRLIFAVSSVATSDKSSTGEDCISDYRTLVHGSLEAVSAVVRALPCFMSPYLVDLLSVLTSKDLLVQGRLDSLGTAASETHRRTLQQLAELIPVRLLLPAIRSRYVGAVIDGGNSIETLMRLLATMLQRLKRSEVKKHSVEISEFFILALDHLIDSTSDSFDSPLVKRGEKAVIAALVSFVVKMTELELRPFFHKLCHWASNNNSCNDMRYLVLLLLYLKILNLFLFLLLGIFGNYVLNFSKFHNKRQRCEITRGTRNLTIWLELRTRILLTIQRTCRYDTGDFIDQSRFELIMPRIVNVLDGDGFTTRARIEYQEYMETFVIPCLWRLAAAAGTDILWKPLNHMVLLKTRSESAKIRHASLMVIQQMYQNLGEDMLVLLPETIPFIAELMEDSDEQVENVCMEMKEQIEELSGEKLDDYLMN